MSNSPRLVTRSSRRLLSVAALVSLLGLSVAQLSAQAPADPNAGRRRGGPGGQDPGNGNGGGRGNFSPEEAQARMLTALRERFEITNDEEWGLISKRLATVMEIRRTTGGGGGGPGGPGGGRGGPPSGGGGNADTGGRGGRGGRTNNPEIAALQAAITDNLPEAEIKSRLERVRELRRDAEAKLLKAQEDLRAVLSVKQEANAVLFGLLP